MVRPIRGYEGPQAGVSVPGFPSSVGQGENFSRLGTAFFDQAARVQKSEDRRAQAIASEAGVAAGRAGRYELQDSGTIMGAAFNEMARDTFAKQLETSARLKIKELGAAHAADPDALSAKLQEYSAGVVEEIEGFDPAIASGFGDVFGLLSADAVLQAQENAKKVAIDANRAAVTAAYTERGQSISQLSRRNGAGDLEAGMAAQVERDLMLADYLKSGPAAPFEFNGEQFPAGNGSFTVQEIQQKMQALDAEMDDQAIIGWWEAGEPSAARADQWYASEVTGISQDRKDAIYRVMLGDAKEADYRAQKAQAAADRARDLANSRAASDLAISLSRGEAGYAEVEKAYNDGMITPAARAEMTIRLDKRNNDLAELQAGLALVDAAKRGDVRLDPSNSMHRDLVSADFKEQAGAFLAGGDKTEADFQAWTVNYAVEVGVVPDDVKAKWRGALVSGSPEQQVAAADAIEQLRLANPFLLDASFEKSDIERATMLADQARAGVPYETAVGNVNDAMRLDQATITARDAAFAQTYKPAPGRTQFQAMQSDLQGIVNDRAESWFGWVPGVDAAPQVPDEMVAQYELLLKDSYRRTGDMATAKKSAGDSLRNAWSVSRVNGGEQWMKSAPELYYAAPAQAGLSATENAEWMRNQLFAEVTENALIDPENPMTPDRISLVPDALGRRGPDGRPLYVVMIQGPQGLSPVLDGSGRPMPWAPDWDSSAKKSEMVLEQAQQLFDARLIREGKQVSKSSSAPGGAVTSQRIAPMLERAGEEMGYFTGKEKDGLREFVPVDRDGKEGLARYLNPGGK